MQSEEEKKNKMVEVDTFEEISLYVSKSKRVQQVLYIRKSN